MPRESKRAKQERAVEVCHRVGEIYGGLDIEVDPLAGEYLAQRIRRLTQAVDGLLKGGSADNARRAQELGEIITALKERRDAL